MRLERLRFQYQHRLTRYFLKFYKIMRFRSFLTNEFSVLNILLKSHLVPDNDFAALFVARGLVYINGVACLNRFFQVFLGDFVQIIVSIKYYIVCRWFISWALQKSYLLRKLIRQKSHGAQNLEEKQKSKLLPQKILRNSGVFDDALRYVEIDFFTLSIIILYEPFQITDVDPTHPRSRRGIINLYN